MERRAIDPAIPAGRGADRDRRRLRLPTTDRKPQTTYELTDLGRGKFEEHVRTLELLLDRVDEEQA